jgi:hypothetical protein
MADTINWNSNSMADGAQSLLEDDVVDDDDGVPDDDVPEDEDDEGEDDVEAKILQLQDQFAEVKQQRREARLVSHSTT